MKKKPAKKDALKPRLEDKVLITALQTSYAARANLFHGGVANHPIMSLFDEIDSMGTVVSENEEWTNYGVDPIAAKVLHKSGVDLHKVFVKPSLIAPRPHLLGYYRNLAALSQKGGSQLGIGTKSIEKRNAKPITETRSVRIAAILNGILSSVVIEQKRFSLATMRNAAFAEIGTELQGTWANTVGTGATKAVDRIIAEYVEQVGCGTKVSKRKYELTNGWSIVFASEPDISFIDGTGREQISIEIKGSLDRAGAQTRYGEAKKSFAKSLLKNPRCYTVYLASVFTDSVVRQISSDGQVRKTFNLTQILYEPSEQRKFIEHLFYVMNTPQ